MKKPKNRLINGRGIEKLKAASAEVITSVLEADCIELNKRFFTFHQQQRPYIILKWAQTADKKIGSTDNKRLIISNELTSRLVHKWRFEEASILIGTNTAALDDPELTNRLWNGKNPVRLVVDKNLKLPCNLKIFNNQAPTIAFNFKKTNLAEVTEFSNQVYYYRLEIEKSLVQQIVKACYSLNIQSILVEGGTRLLQSFIDENLYDETRIITNQKLSIGKGLESPHGYKGNHLDVFLLENDLVEILR